EIESTGSLLLPRMIGATAIIHLLSGDLPQARFEARRMRETAIPNESVLNVSWAHYLEGLGDLHCMDLDSALDHFAAGSEHPRSTDARAAVDALAGLALTQQLTQRTAAATATVQRVIDFTFELNDPFAIDAARSCQARIQLLQGNLAEAFNWAKSVNVQLDRLALLIWLEAAPITQARVLIACGSPACLQQAAELLQQVRDLSEASRFACQIIEVAVLQSLLLYKQGRKDSALISLEQAVAMAAPGGWVRPFAELGRPMTELLAQLAVEGAEEDLVQRVLASNDTSDMLSSTNEIRGATPSPAPATAVQASAARAGRPPDALTNRELDILELLVRRFQNKEIAAKLFISTHTVNYHLKHIFQKLGVSNRRQAVTKAAKIGILPPA
ncbi:MAG: LuxR C-terminal-related transcriptional regulator, partial [Paracoccaceae bacterium]|nr:LuxR C-terminal-related transcriptional regulator [Paracoccaceae bacterium]